MRTQGIAIAALVVAIASLAAVVGLIIALIGQAVPVRIVDAEPLRLRYGEQAEMSQHLDVVNGSLAWRRLNVVYDDVNISYKFTLQNHSDAAIGTDRFGITVRFLDADGYALHADGWGGAVVVPAHATAVFSDITRIPVELADQIKFMIVQGV